MEIMIESLRDPVKEILTPEPDGIAVDFNTSQAYKPGAISIWINGIKKIKDWDDGFLELNSNTIRTKSVLLPGDSIQAEYQAA